jgi:hypothetical protein
MFLLQMMIQVILSSIQQSAFATWKEAVVVVNPTEPIWLRFNRCDQRNAGRGFSSSYPWMSRFGFSHQITFYANEPTEQWTTTSWNRKSATVHWCRGTPAFACNSNVNSSWIRRPCLIECHCSCPSILALAVTMALAQHMSSLFCIFRLPFMQMNQLNSELLLAEIERVLQSNEQFVLDHCVQLNIAHVSLPKGFRWNALSISHISDILPGIVETFLHLRFRIDVGVLPPWCVIPAPSKDSRSNWRWLDTLSRLWTILQRTNML